MKIEICLLKISIMIKNKNIAHVLNKFHQYTHFKKIEIFKLKLFHDEFVWLYSIFDHDHKINFKKFAKFKYFSYQWHDQILKTKSTNVTNTICDEKNHNDSRLKKMKMIRWNCQTNTLISILYILLTIFFKRSYSIIVC